VLYRERSGGKSFDNGEIVRPERFRYSDLKEAVWETFELWILNGGEDREGAKKRELTMGERHNECSRRSFPRPMSQDAEGTGTLMALLFGQALQS
jgi:hypothetical protein